MAVARTLSVPDFDFSSFYYQELVEAGIKYLRNNVPEITSENAGEPAIQLLRAWSLIGHICNVNTDIVAHEGLFATSQLRDSVVAHLKLIDFTVDGEIPARVKVVATLTKTFTTTTEVITDNALFATKRTGLEDARVYEADSSVSVNRTDQITFAKFDDGGAFTDIATEVNTDSTPVEILPTVPAVGDAVYFGHDSAMTNRLRFTGITTIMADVFGQWEFFDDDLFDDFPDSVTNLGATLEIVIDSMLGTDGTLNFTGLEVQVQFDETGATETLTSTWDGTNNKITTTGFLGQTAPSVDAEDYTVGTLWHRLPDQDDDTNNGNTSLELDGNLDFVLPKSQVADWQPGEVNADTASWIRFRVTAIGGTPTAPILDRVEWNKRDTFVQVDTTQGQTRTEVVGSSIGDPNQKFVLNSSPVIEGTIAITVDASTWTEVENFLSSTNVDEHFRTTLDSDGLATVIFGDGETGKIPPIGVNNISATYRTDAELDGNVGADQIVVNRTGLANIKKVTNPKPATFWVERRGSNDTDREKLKFEGPASLRTLGRAVASQDFETLAIAFAVADGSKPFVRAKSVEEGFGTSTVKVIVVGAAGALIAVSQRDELEVFFNGDEATGESGVIVVNQRAFVRNYTPRSIDVTVSAPGGNKAAIETALNQLLSPVALESDGITFVWDFGDPVTLADLTATIINADTTQKPSDVIFTLPAANVILASDELPTKGTILVTV